MNIALYLFFTAVCFYFARPPATVIRRVNVVVADSKPAQHLPSLLRRAVTLRKMEARQTVAICFCGAAKTTGLGIPLVAAMWNASDNMTRAYIQIPVLLYTMEQVGARC